MRGLTRPTGADTGAVSETRQIVGGFGSGGSGVGSGVGDGGPGSGGSGGPGMGSGVGAGGSRLIPPSCPQNACRTPTSSSRRTTTRT